jgi:hypothetical protein
MTYNPSSEEREAYIHGYDAVGHGNFKLDLFPRNPYDNVAESLLWEAWEVGFNDSFEDEIKILRIIEELSNGQENSTDG